MIETGIDRDRLKIDRDRDKDRSEDKDSVEVLANTKQDSPTQIIYGLPTSIQSAPSCSDFYFSSSGYMYQFARDWMNKILYRLGSWCCNCSN